MVSGFPYFLQFKPEFCNKEFMIWATISPRSYFCWLHRASPSLAAKNIICLILILAIWWCPHVESFLVLLEKGVYYGQCVLLTKFCWPLSCFILYSKARLNLLFWVSLNFLFLHPNLLWWKGHLFFFFFVLFFGVVGLHRTGQPWALTDFSFPEPSMVEALQAVEWYLQVWMCNKNRWVKRLWELKRKLFQSHFSFFVSNHLPGTSHCTPDELCFCLVW